MKPHPAWLLAFPGALILWKLAGGGGTPGTHRFNLRSQAFDDARHPGVIARIPPSYTGGAAHVVVYYHGWNGCIETLVGDVRAPCDPGGPSHMYSSLISQFDRSGIDAVLVVPQLRFNAESGDAGRLDNTNGLRNLLDELLPKIGVGGVSRVTVCAHSGGYGGAASAIARGGVPVSGCVLFDALYGNVSTFEAFARAPGTKLVDLYTAGGGTMANSTALESRLRAAGIPASKARFERISVAHSDVPLRYFESALREM